jgi:hypothetical protein
MNVLFEYLYRDAGNYKNWGNVIFSNPQNESIEDLILRLRLHLIDETYFVAKKARVPDLHFNDYDEELDHGWHEFDSLECTSESPTDVAGRDINQFILDLKSAI